jgi:selenocysteine lyase/cysteine desulfurase
VPDSNESNVAPLAPGEDVRRLFRLTREVIELSAMAISSHPEPVARAIHEFRTELDRSPNLFLLANNRTLAPAVFAVAGRYFGLDHRLVAYTHSTTVGLAQIYAGLRIAPGQEILTSVNEHFTTLEALRLRARRDGTPFRQIELFRDPQTITHDEIAERLAAAIRPWTRVLALTWVYSTDGVKLPIATIADVVRQENEARPPNADRLLLVVDGVHGFGVEDANFGDLGCDLFVAGCHKWVFGPRGTAVMYGADSAWREVVPVLPSFSSADDGIAQLYMPGGNFAFEHFWAVAAAFEFLLSIGKPQVAAYVHGLCDQLKRELTCAGVTVRTPRTPEFSAGIVAFDVDGVPARDVVRRLRDEFHISATESAFDITGGRSHVRFSPAVFNTEDEIRRAAEAVRQIAGS